MAFCKQSAVTEVLTQTLCATWDQTLIFDEIEIYESVENVAKNPPSVVVELFDRDSVVSMRQNRKMNKQTIKQTNKRTKERMNEERN